MSRSFAARQAGALLVLCLFLALVGCAASPAPIVVDNSSPAGLKTIRASFVRAVGALKSDPEVRWHAGWTGNISVNFWRGDNRGLCYEWRDEIYQRVAPDAVEAGWDAIGIAINRGTSAEHHCVLVFDRKRLRVRDLLPEPPAPLPSDHAFVLDAWRRGEADIYRLTDWVELPKRDLVPPELVDMEAYFKRGGDPRRPSAAPEAR